ncbi:MAG: DoxX family membrane protein [Alphaproteobacteria bacterium]|nr:DoxX family membrane protein [Alphaproteobacteria bacterium]
MVLAKAMDFAGRFLIAALFLLAAANKFVNTDAILHHMNVQHVPDYLLPLVVVLEVCAGLAILIGWQLRWAALALAAFCVATAVLFHMDFSQPVERTMFAKDLAIAGGLLILSATAFTNRR